MEQLLSKPGTEIIVQNTGPCPREWIVKENPKNVNQQREREVGKKIYSPPEHQIKELPGKKFHMLGLPEFR